jgi:hypothetical protein
MAKAANGIRRNGEKKSPSGERKSENNGEAAWRNNGGESVKWHGEKSKYESSMASAKQHMAWRGEIIGAKIGMA